MRQMVALRTTISATRTYSPMRFFCVLSLCAVCLVGALRGQQSISVSVLVSSLEMRGDTTRVTYLVTNSPNSQEALFRFRVDAPSPPVHIFMPEPSSVWTTTTMTKGIPVAGWTALEATVVPPGASSPPLVFEAVGLPTVVTSWVVGLSSVPLYQALPETSVVRPPPRDAIAAGSVAGKVVGVDSFPADLTPANLLARLRGLTDQACDSVAWISSTTVCSSLRGKLDLASQAVAQGDTATARNELTNFVASLDAQHGTGLPVNDNAYWLLKVNAEFILGRL